MAWTRMSLALAAFLAATVPAPATADDPFQFQRNRMVTEQIEARGIRHREVLRVMRATPRHLFVPSSVQAAAYEDRPIAIGYGATISQPYIVALMTELLAPGKRDRVLEIGTGSGYQAAILAQLVAEVYTIEIVPELARSAATILRARGHSNVVVRHGDGYAGWVERAPFDGIVVTAAPPEIPEALVNQLAKGGRLVVPVGFHGSQELVLIEKLSDGSLRRRSITDVMFIPMVPAPR